MVALCTLQRESIKSTRIVFRRLYNYIELSIMFQYNNANKLNVCEIIVYHISYGNNGYRLKGIIMGKLERIIGVYNGQE